MISNFPEVLHFHRLSHLELAAASPCSLNPNQPSSARDVHGQKRSSSLWASSMQEPLLRWESEFITKPTGQDFWQVYELWGFRVIDRVPTVSISNSSNLSEARGRCNSVKFFMFSNHLLWRNLRKKTYIIALGTLLWSGNGNRIKHRTFLDVVLNMRSSCVCVCVFFFFQCLSTWTPQLC